MLEAQYMNFRRVKGCRFAPGWYVVDGATGEMLTHAFTTERDAEVAAHAIRRERDPSLQAARATAFKRVA